MGTPGSFLSYKRERVMRVFSAGHIVAMVIYCARKSTVTGFPMIGQFFDIMMLASTSMEWLK